MTNSIHNDLKAFITEWESPSEDVLVHTSGSTGKPKPFNALKHQMLNSARLTCDFLNLRRGDTALLCMPLKYIAGKMVVVRSLERGLKLIVTEPSSQPLKDVETPITFAAMTPMQVYATLQDEIQRKRLMNVRELIIGGGAVDETLAEELRTFPNRVWSTYGMTETLSHIAMRRINGDEASEWYTPLDNIDISLSADNTLCINAPLVCNEKLVTNDIAVINDKGEFRIIGRRDNVINSGGIKIQIEEMEALLKPHITHPFVVTSAPDEKFGEIVVMISEENDIDRIAEVCRNILPTHWQPKRYICHAVPLTQTNKPDRATAKRIASENQ